MSTATTDWITDERGNRCSVSYWGNEEVARKALASLTSCDSTTNCSDCSRCSGCSDFAPAKVMAEIPIIPNIHTAIYEAASQPNALNMATFHSCKTTHCRAGWAIHLAGDAGYTLECQTSATFAAMQI